ncbi:MAG TPA: hypothetical protein PKY10_05525, partial [Lentisphaeria bacterium]|nr:hypothetical protein [Lentisphaeria bacterium]
MPVFVSMSMPVVMSVPVAMIIMRGVGVNDVEVAADDSMLAPASGELQAYGCQSCLVQYFFYGLRVGAEVNEGSQDHVASGAGQGFKRDDS